MDKQKVNVNKMNIKTDALKEVLLSMSDKIKADQLDLFNKIIENSEIKKFDNYEEFYFAILYPFNEFVDSFVKNKMTDNDDVAFIIRNSQFIENNFEHLIEAKEGSTCCADKSRTIMKQLINFYATGEKIAFNYEGKYTYHLPEKILKTHDHIVLFYEGLRGLYYGLNKKYFEALSTILELKKKE